MGVNIAHEQDEYLSYFMKSSGYSFTALREDASQRTNLPVNRAPTNYLIKGQGCIIHKNFLAQRKEVKKTL